MSRDKSGKYVAGGVSERRRQWVGERFGRLIVTDVEYGVKRGNKQRTMCTCKCDCGKEIRTVSEYLVAGKTSCGCDTSMKRSESNRLDLTGMRFGRLVVQEMLWVKPHTKCRCICDCGKETIVINTGLTSGKTQSCGCYQSERTSESNTKDYSGMATPSGIKFIKRYKQNERGVWLWECECPVCHKTFYNIPAFLKAWESTSCGCDKSQISEPERWIARLLDESGVKYKSQYSFDDCRDVHLLRFDFAILSEDNIVTHLIEYDGAQHYRPVEFYGGQEKFESLRRRDKIKNDYCKQHNIPLTRMPYTMSMDEIKDTIENIINP